MQLLLIFGLFLFSLALGSPSDVLYIKKLNADVAQSLDAKDFAGLANTFTKNATYNAGDPFPTVYGINSIQATLAARLGRNITQYAITTQSITLLPPFNEQGAAGTATGVVYPTVANIGQGNLTGEALIVFGKYEDKYVKTRDVSRYGGWRIRDRFFISFGEPAGNRDVFQS